MSDECDHDWELGQITSDPWNTLQRVENAYYFCRNCLFTVRKPVTTGLEPPKKESEDE